MISSIFQQVKWDFQENNDGAEEGLNDAGVETFKGTPFESLAREIIQNSSDARYDKTKPVRVVFELMDVDTNHFPDKSYYLKTIEQCESYWKDNKKTKTFFSKASNLLKQPTIPVLKISDYNTTGLTGSKDVQNSNWFGLIKSTGVSNKGGGSGGSFGIGKNAPFACSDLRTVFYNTYDVEGICAFQGVGKLATHKKGFKKTRSIGYFGDAKGNNPIFEKQTEDSSFYEERLYGRKEHGTDVFVFGFTGKKDWQRKMIISILENFFVSIYRNLLEVEVDGVLINKCSLEDMLQEYTANEKESLSMLYYRALTEGQSFNRNDESYDGLNLYLLEGRDLPKRVAMVRGMGMKIFDKGHFRGTTRFVGVLVVEGNKVNARLRDLEPPSHDKWEPERAENSVSKERAYLKGLNDWIKNCVDELIDVNEEEAIDFSGAGEFLPSETEESIGGIEEKKRETLDREDKKQRIDVKVKKKKKEIEKGNELIEEEWEDGGDGDGGSGGFPEEKDSKGDKGITGGGSGGGNEEPGEREITGGATVTDKKLNVNIRRSFMVKERAGEYRVSFTSKQSKIGFFVIDVIGETSKESFTIAKAATPSGEEIPVQNGKFIGPIKLEKDKPDSIVFQFEKPIRYALNIQVLEGKR